MLFKYHSKFTKYLYKNPFVSSQIFCLFQWVIFTATVRNETSISSLLPWPSPPLKDKERHKTSNSTSFIHTANPSWCWNLQGENTAAHAEPRLSPINFIIIQQVLYFISNCAFKAAYKSGIGVRHEVTTTQFLTYSFAQELYSLRYTERKRGKCPGVFRVL